MHPKPVSRRSPSLSSTLTSVLLLALLLVSTPTMAADPNFEQGLSAFANNDFQKALQHFKQAERNGMNNGRLYYNIGVSHFKLGQLSDARAAFVLAASDPELAGLAYYNLALIAYQGNNIDQARNRLQQCREHSTDKRLLALADELQTRLPAQAAAASHRSTALISLHAGYDDNVTLSDDNQPVGSSGRSDRMIEVLVFGRQSHPLRETLSLTLDASLYQQDYLNLNDYDVLLLRFGAGLEQDIHQHWQWLNDGHITKTTIAGKQSTHSFSLQSGLQRRQRHQTTVVDFQIARIEADSALYQHLDGWRYRLSARQAWKQAQQRYSLSSDITSNDRSDYRTATQFSSYSPQRLSLSGSVQTKLTPQLDGSLKLNWRYSRYRDANLLADASIVRREEHRQRLTGRLRYPLSDNTKLQLEYRHSRNNSTLSNYDYHQNQIYLGIIADW